MATDTEVAAAEIWMDQSGTWVVVRPHFMCSAMQPWYLIGPGHVSTSEWAQRCGRGGKGGCRDTSESPIQHLK